MIRKLPLFRQVKEKEKDMNLIPMFDGTITGNYVCTWCCQGGAEGMNEAKLFGRGGLLKNYALPQHPS